jgi:hypothetical protein
MLGHRYGNLTLRHLDTYIEGECPRIVLPLIIDAKQTIVNNKKIKKDKK